MPHPGMGHDTMSPSPLRVALGRDTMSLLPSVCHRSPFVPLLARDTRFAVHRPGVLYGTIALREMQMLTLTQILKIAQDLYHSFINSAQIKYSR